MDRKTYDGRKLWSKCVRCGEFTEHTKHDVQRAVTGFLTIEQVSNLDAQLVRKFELDSPSGSDFSYVHVEDACPTCIVELMASSV